MHAECTMFYKTNVDVTWLVLSITWRVSAAPLLCRFFWLRPCVSGETRTQSVSWSEPFSPLLELQPWSKPLWESGEIYIFITLYKQVWCHFVNLPNHTKNVRLKKQRPENSSVCLCVCVDFLCFRRVRLLFWFLLRPSSAWSAGSVRVTVRWRQV